MTTVIYHSADYDGIFCREIARKFMPDAELIGWNFGDKPLPFPDKETRYYVLDLPMDKPWGLRFEDGWLARDNPIQSKDERQIQPLDRIDWEKQWVWIDHHKTSINTHPRDIPGYRIDGVAACRLAWQWFQIHEERPNDFNQIMLPDKDEYIDRDVPEPLAVRLAGEYDVWDKRDPMAGQLQYGLRSVDLESPPLHQAYGNWWKYLLGTEPLYETVTMELCQRGQSSQVYAQHVDAGNMKASFLREWEGLKFLCLNGRGNSLTFASKDVPETGHDALLMFYFQGTSWVVSLYHAAHHTDLDLSEIAKKYGGGGHRGACGFTCKTLPFIAHEACEKGSL